MKTILFVMSYIFDSMNGIWYCEEHNTKIRINKNPLNEKIEIDYFDDTQNVSDSETTTIKTINDVTGMNCHLGEFTVFFDGNNFLHLLAYFSSEKSYIFERL